MKENYKFIIILLIILFVFWYPLPYYVDAPGGLTNLNNKVSIDDKSIDGSYNLTYVSEYKASIPLLIYSLFNKDYDVYKKDDILLENETDDEYNKRDKLFLEESLSNAVIAAYNMASNQVIIKNNYLYVGYILTNSNTDLEVGDEINSIDNVSVKTKEDVNSLLSTKSVGDKITIKVSNNNHNYIRYAILQEEDGKKIIGIIPIEVYDYETDPQIDIKMSANESGSSGGLMLSLAIYDLLSDDNLAQGRKVAGTGTIDSEGNVGEIGGIEYKIKGAVKDKADIFFVPNDNYKEAQEVLADNNYDLNLVKVNTLKEAIDYLKVYNE